MLVWGLDGNCMYMYLYCSTKQIEETRHVWELRKIHYDRVASDDEMGQR